MRTRINRHPRLDIVLIEELRLNPKSRDDNPKVLRALQALNMEEESRERHLVLLDAHIVSVRASTS